MKLRYCTECAAPLTQRELQLLEVHTIRYRENEASLSIVFHAPRWDGEPTAGDDAAALVWRQVDVVESDEFAWHIPGLAAKLRALAAAPR